MNHSCDPNAKAFKREEVCSNFRVTPMDQCLPRMIICLGHQLDVLMILKSSYGLEFEGSTLRANIGRLNNQVTDQFQKKLKKPSH